MLSAEPPLAVSRSWAQYQRDQGKPLLAPIKDALSIQSFRCMAGTTGPESATSAVTGNNRYVFQHLTMHRDWLSTRKSWKTASSVGWTVG